MVWKIFGYNNKNLIKYVSKNNKYAIIMETFKNG
jgi:hypothetical protein